MPADCSRIFFDTCLRYIERGSVCYFSDRRAGRCKARLATAGSSWWLYRLVGIDPFLPSYCLSAEVGLAIWSVAD